MIIELTLFQAFLGGLALACLWCLAVYGVYLTIVLENKKKAVRYINKRFGYVDSDTIKRRCK